MKKSIPEDVLLASERFSEDKYGYVACPDYSVHVGKKELKDLRVLASAYVDLLSSQKRKSKNA